MPEVEQYPPLVGLVYVFNLIVGTGALTLPAAFAGAGWLFSSFLMVLLAFVSFVTATFVLETMACANATLQWRRNQSLRLEEEDASSVSSSEGEEGSSEHTAILSVTHARKYFHLNGKIELGEMARLYFNRLGYLMFFLSLCVYLYGDLAIYTAASGKTIVNLSCKPSNDSENYQDTCWDGYSVTRMTMYRFFVAIFALCVCPFTYFNVQKTKHLQVLTIAIRWFAFAVMLTLASVSLIRNGPLGHPSLVNLREVPALAGSSVYSFMCHHSLPSLIAPISNKQHLMKKLTFDFTIICGFYLLLSLTGSFAFEKIDVLYSLNFIPAQDAGVFMQIIGFFLGAFPLFPMSTSFPIIAITLQSNLKCLFLDEQTARTSFVVRRLLFPTLAVLPPVLVALCTHNLKTLVEITGTYAGVVVQYILPAILVLNARRLCKREFGSAKHRFASPCRHFAWFAFVILWAILCIIFVTVDFSINK